MKTIPIDNNNNTLPIEVEHLIKLSNHENILKYVHHFFDETNIFSKKLCIITEYYEVKQYFNWTYSGVSVFVPSRHRSVP